MRLLHLECNCESDTFQGERKDRRKAQHRPLGDLVNENRRVGMWDRTG